MTLERDTWVERLIEFALMNIAFAPLTYPHRWGIRSVRMLGLLVYPVWLFVTAPIWAPLALIGIVGSLVVWTWRGEC